MSSNDVLYGYFKTHALVESFRHELSSISEFPRAYSCFSEKELEIMCGLWKFLEERGFLTKKQIHLALSIFQKHSIQWNL